MGDDKAAGSYPRIESASRRESDIAVLGALRFSLEIGCCSILKKQMNYFGPDLEQSPDPDVRIGYAQLLADADPAFRIEEEHGRGSLIKLDHPAVTDIIGRERPRVPAAITQKEIEAAIRYRWLTAQAN